MKTTKETKELADILTKFIPRAIKFYPNISLSEIIVKVEGLYAKPEGRRNVQEYIDAVDYLFHKGILSLEEGNPVFDKYATLNH